MKNMITFVFDTIEGIGLTDLVYHGLGSYTGTLLSVIHGTDSLQCSEASCNVIF